MYQKILYQKRISSV